MSDEPVAEVLADLVEAIPTLSIQDQVPGVTFRQLDYWSRTDLLRTVGFDGRANPDVGQGHRRMHPVSEVAVVALVSRLLAAGFHVQAAFEVARVLVHGSAMVLPGGFTITKAPS